MGSIYVSKQPIVETLLAEGMVAVTNPDLYDKKAMDIQKEAEKNQRGLWTPELQSITIEESKDIVQKLRVVVTHVSKGRRIYYQTEQNTKIIEDKLLPVLEEMA